MCRHTQATAHGGGQRTSFGSQVSFHWGFWGPMQAVRLAWQVLFPVESSHHPGSTSKNFSVTYDLCSQAGPKCYISRDSEKCLFQTTGFNRAATNSYSIYGHALFMVRAGMGGDRVLVCYLSWPRTCSLQTASSKAWVTLHAHVLNRKKPSTTHIQDTASNEPIYIKDIFISSHLKCKSQRKEKQLFPVNKVQHNCTILHIVKVHVDGGMLFSHTVHGDACQRRSKESGPNSFILSP